MSPDTDTSPLQIELKPQLFTTSATIKQAIAPAATELDLGNDHVKLCVPRLYWCTDEGVAFEPGHFGIDQEMGNKPVNINEELKAQILELANQRLAFANKEIRSIRAIDHDESGSRLYQVDLYVSYSEEQIQELL